MALGLGVGEGVLGDFQRLFGGAQLFLRRLAAPPRFFHQIGLGLAGAVQLLVLGFEPGQRRGGVLVMGALAGEVSRRLGDPALCLRLALGGALFLAFQSLAGEDEALQSGGGLGLRVAQDWHAMGRERLQARGFGLLTSALGDIEHIGLEGVLRFVGVAQGLAVCEQGDQRLVAADFGGERPVARGLSGLTAQGIGLGADLGQNVFEPDEIFLGAFEAQLRLLAARMQPADSGGFLENAAAGLRLGRNDLADLALAHHGGRARARRSVGEQQLHVAGAHFAAVDAIGRTLLALDPPGDFENVGIVEHGGRRARAVVERQDHLGVVARRARAGAGEDHVVHAGRAHLLVGILAHDPAQGLDEIGLAATVRPHHAGQAGGDDEIGRLNEALEAGQSQLFESHAGRGRSLDRSEIRAP